MLSWTTYQKLSTHHAFSCPYPDYKDVYGPRLKTQAYGLSCIQSIVDCKQNKVDSTLRVRQIDCNALVKVRAQGYNTPNIYALL